MTPVYTIARVIKRIGWTIGFTNGCFDILHAGHISLLKTARRRCDVLFVGINDDASIRRLKGHGRPINDLKKRVGALQETGICDGIFAFGSESELEDLIKDIRPDFLIKGADYKGKTITGDSYVRGYGGILFFAPLVKGVSTTAIIEG